MSYFKKFDSILDCEKLKQLHGLLSSSLNFGYFAAFTKRIENKLNVIKIFIHEARHKVCIVIFCPIEKVFRRKTMDLMEEYDWYKSVSGYEFEYDNMESALRLYHAAVNDLKEQGLTEITDRMLFPKMRQRFVNFEALGEAKESYIETEEENAKGMANSLRKKNFEYAAGEDLLFILSICGRICKVLASIEEKIWNIERLKENSEKGWDEIQYNGNAEYEHFSESVTLTFEHIEKCKNLFSAIANIQLDGPSLDFIHIYNEALEKIEDELVTDLKYLRIHESDASIMDNDEYRSMAIRSLKRNIQSKIESAEETTKYREENSGGNIDGAFRKISLPDLDNPKISLKGVNIRLGDQSLMTLVSEKIKPLTNNFRCWYVTNDETENAYNQNKSAVKGVHANEMLLWHGTVTESWISIISNGLKIMPNPENGRMFGDGLYFAPLSFKSLGYTSIKDSKYGGGQDDFGFIGLYRVRVGNPLYPTSSGQYKLKDLDSDGYDSIYAKANTCGLRYDEVIVYDEAQCTIFAIVQVMKSEETY